jgi:hypothetical protein
MPCTPVITVKYNGRFLLKEYSKECVGQTYLKMNTWTNLYDFCNVFYSQCNSTSLLCTTIWFFWKIPSQYVFFFYFCTIVINLLTRACTNQTTIWLVRNWNIFCAWTSHDCAWIHKIHHGLDLREATTFPLIVFFMPNHGANTQMSFCPRTPKLESWNSLNWDFCNFGGP